MNRRFLFAIGLVLLFATVVVVWYFFYAAPTKAPTLGGVANPLGTNTTPRFFQFIFNNKNAGGSQGNQTTEVTPASEQPLVEVWGKPSTGQVFVTQPILIETSATTTQKGTTTPLVVKKMVRATTTIMMFVDRTTGYIYGYNIESGLTYQISNTTIPGIYDAYIFGNGTRVALRYLDRLSNTPATILGNVPTVQPGSDARPLEKIVSLPDNISSLAVNKSGDKLSYLVPSSYGSSIYTVSPKGTTFVSASPFREWALSYGGDTLYETTKPSAFLKGVTVVAQTGDHIIGKTGLMSAVSEKGTVLNSMWSNTGLVTFLFTPKGELVLSGATLAPKCVWGKTEFLVCGVPKSLPVSQEGLPDDWFQGLAQFDDTLSIVDTASGAVHPLYSFDANLGVFDVTKLTLSNDNSLISFIRKQDGSLWLLKTNLIPVE
jgi:hypothetical protein